MYMKDFLQDLDQKLNALHERFIGEGMMDVGIKKKIIAEISDDELPMGRRYTPEAIIEAITKVLIKYEPYRSIAERMKE